MPIWLVLLVCVSSSLAAFALGIHMGADSAIRRIGNWMIANNYRHVLREYRNEFVRSGVNASEQ